MLTLFHIHPPRLHTLHLAVTQWNGLGNLQHRRLQRPARVLLAEKGGWKIWGSGKLPSGKKTCF